MDTKIYIDFEMNKYRDGPCEIIAIGAVKVKGDTITDRFHSLISMRKSDEVCVHVSILTGITTMDLEKAPSFNTVWKIFTEWCNGCSTFCWGEYDKSSLIYTGKVNQGITNSVPVESIIKMANSVIDLEKGYGYDKIYKKQSLKDIVLSLNKDFSIDNRKVHNPTYDAELLFEFHKQIKRPK